MFDMQVYLQSPMVNYSNNIHFICIILYKVHFFIAFTSLRRYTISLHTHSDINTYNVFNKKKMMKIKRKQIYGELRSTQSCSRTTDDVDFFIKLHIKEKNLWFHNIITHIFSNLCCAWSNIVQMQYVFGKMICSIYRMMV